MAKKKSQVSNLQDLKNSQELIGISFSLIAEASHQGIKSEQVAKVLKFLDGLYVETTAAIEAQEPTESSETVEA